MDDLKKAISVILAAVMLFMLLPAIAKNTENTAGTAEDEDAQRLDSYYSLVLSAIDDEDYETAKMGIDACFSLCDPETDAAMYADLLLKQACIAVMEGQNDAALQSLEAALAIQPELADAYLVRTQIYASLGRADRATKNLEKYIELTEDASLYETVAQLYETNGDWDAAEKSYEKYIVGTGGDMAKADLQAGIYRMHAGCPDEAIAVLADCFDSSTYGAEAAYYTGICKMSLGDHSGARAAFDACLEKGGDFEGVYYNRGVCALVSDDWEAAAADFMKSIETEPYADDARYNLGVCQMQLEDYEAAVASFTALVGDGSKPDPEEQEEAAENNAIDTEARYGRAMCYAMLGDWEAAIADYTACIDRGYELAQCYAQRAQVYAALGDTEQYEIDLLLAQEYEDKEE